jgi:hypothetical protein
MPVIRNTQEAEIGKMMFWGQPGQKVNETPSQKKKKKKLGIVAHAYHPKYAESVSRRTEQTPSQKQPNQERPGILLKSYHTCLSKALSSNSNIAKIKSQRDLK